MTVEMILQLSRTYEMNDFWDLHVEEETCVSDITEEVESVIVVSNTGSLLDTRNSCSNKEDRKKKELLRRETNNQMQQRQCEANQSLVFRDRLLTTAASNSFRRQSSEKKLSFTRMHRPSRIVKRGSKRNLNDDGAATIKVSNVTQDSSTSNANGSEKNISSNEAVKHNSGGSTSQKEKLSCNCDTKSMACHKKKNHDDAEEKKHKRDGKEQRYQKLINYSSRSSSCKSMKQITARSSIPSSPNTSRTNNNKKRISQTNSGKQIYSQAISSRSIVWTSCSDHRTSYTSTTIDKSKRSYPRSKSETKLLQSDSRKSISKTTRKTKHIDGTAVKKQQSEEPSCTKKSNLKENTSTNITAKKPQINIQHANNHQKLKKHSSDRRSSHIVSSIRQQQRNGQTIRKNELNHIQKEPKAIGFQTEQRRINLNSPYNLAKHRRTSLQSGYNYEEDDISESSDITGTSLSSAEDLILFDNDDYTGNKSFSLLEDIIGKNKFDDDDEGEQDLMKLNWSCHELIFHPEQKGRFEESQIL